MIPLCLGVLVGCEATMGGLPSTDGAGAQAAGSQMGFGAGGTVASGGTAGTSTGGAHEGNAGSVSCSAVERIGAAPIRRLTRFEYNKTVEAILLDDTSPGNSLPPELLGNGFGNDATSQPVSSFLAEQYGIIAEDVGRDAIQNPAVMARYAPCFADVTAASEHACARTFIENFATAAYRRPVSVDEVDELVTLQQEIAGFSDYQTSLASIVETVLQSPDFLYRVEFGEATAQPEVRRPTGYEMASRLSYFFWGTSPDEELILAAEAGELSEPDRIASQARRLLEDPKARDVIRFFFGRFLPIEGLTDLARDPEQFPTFSPQIGALMREETYRFLEYEIFEGPGDWPSALTAPYTFVNEDLAAYYGLEDVVGDEFQKVAVDPNQRKGLLTQGSVLTGSTVSNFTNPVRRGVFLLRNVMCIELPDPPESVAEAVMPPDPSSGDTGRERYAAHSEIQMCAGCHAIMDPPGFALENYDAVGLWRDQENGVTIDASGQIPSVGGPFTGPLELVDIIANESRTQHCFAHKWSTFALGRSLTEEDACVLAQVEELFDASGHDIQQLLVGITQTDAFLYLPAKETL